MFAGSAMIWPADSKEMVRIPAGEFLYGPERQRLYLPEFWIDRAPVTNAEFARFVQASGYQTTAERAGAGCANTGAGWEDVPGADWRHPAGPGTEVPGKDDHPVVQVTWEDAAAYARWAGKRLPTGQEWEKAARGTDGREYPWGDREPAPDLCNFNRHEGRTTPVGKYSPRGDSPYGCADMAGNVWEWTADMGDPIEYPGDPAGLLPARLLCGGGWSHPGEYVRIVLRSPHHPAERYDTDGFRCAVDAPPVLVNITGLKDL
jgi:formylglycine-generating enzyme